MKISFFNTNPKISSKQVNSGILSTISVKKGSVDFIKQEMSSATIAEYVSDKLIELVKKELESPNKQTTIG
ncbi:MAG: hypothetical protein U0U67_06600 [Chitinophagales bacterium]